MTIELKRVGMEKREEAYDVFYRAQRKLISEGKAYMFGGVSPEVVTWPARRNFLYLVYRKGDELPVVAISAFHEAAYYFYTDLLEDEDRKVITLNAMAVRPELWGQGYARQALKLVVQSLREEGFTTVVGTVHPRNEACFATLRHVTDSVKTGPGYPKPTMDGILLERRRFKFRI